MLLPQSEHSVSPSEFTAQVVQPAIILAQSVITKQWVYNNYLSTIMLLKYVQILSVSSSQAQSSNISAVRYLINTLKKLQDMYHF